MIIYQHRKPGESLPFYIGIGSRKDRAFSKRSRSDWWKNIFDKYGREVDVLFEDVDEKQAKQIERYLIAYYGRKDSTDWGILVNMTDGGDGNYNFTEETRNKCGVKNIGRIPWNRGKSMNSETKKRLSSSLKGRISPRKGVKLSDETKKKLSKSHLGIKQNLNTIVVQYSKEGTEINRFRTALEASEFTNISRSAIDNCICGISKISGGYVWKRELKIRN